MLKFTRHRSRKASAGRVRPCLETLEDRCVPTNSATFLGADTTTQGSWMGHYGGTGYVIEGDASNLPSQDKVTIGSGTSTYTYANTTDNLRGLQKAADPTSRIEAGWFNYVYGTPTTGFNVTLKVPGNQVTDPATPVSLYVEDWDGGNRSETIQPLDASSLAPLGPAQTVSNFRDGVYLSWNIKGNVAFQITKLTGPSAELSAVFLGGPSTFPPAGGSAAFVGQNGTANGDWQSAPFGTEGYNVYGGTADYSSYANVSYYGASVGTYTFAASTTDPRGLLNPSNPGSRIAVARYAQSSFTIDVNITDGIAHEVTLYAADWDNAGRSERFDLYDSTTGQPLPGTSYTLSNFAGVGQYLSWDVSGHVQIRVTSLSGPNAVVEGEFFDKDPPPLSGTITPVSATTVSTTSAPPGGAGSAATFPPPGLPNGVDVVLLDTLFANSKHFHDPDSAGLTNGIG
jgi:hypothetical protein